MTTTAGNGRWIVGLGALAGALVAAACSGSGKKTEVPAAPACKPTQMVQDGKCVERSSGNPQGGGGLPPPQYPEEPPPRPQGGGEEPPPGGETPPGTITPPGDTPGATPGNAPGGGGGGGLMDVINGLLGGGNNTPPGGTPPGGTPPGGTPPGNTPPGGKPPGGLPPGGPSNPPPKPPGIPPNPQLPPVTPGLPGPPVTPGPVQPAPGSGPGATTFDNTAPATAEGGAPHVKLLVATRDGRLGVFAALSHKDRVTELAYSYGKERFPLAGTPQTQGGFNGGELTVPVTVTFRFDGRVCRVSASVGLKEVTQRPSCE